MQVDHAADGGTGLKIDFGAGRKLEHQGDIIVACPDRLAQENLPHIYGAVNYAVIDMSAGCR